MRIELRDAGVAPALPPQSMVIASAAPSVIAVETDERPKLLSLLLGGRLRPTSGEVLLDGASDARALRRRIALVDTPFASEPSPTVPLRVAVAEELALAGRQAGRRAVLRALAEHGLADEATTPVELIATAARIRLLAELALAREGVDALVVTSPERHGGDPAAWYPELAELGDRGVQVAIITDRPTASALLALGAVDAAALDRETPDPSVLDRSNA